MVSGAQNAYMPGDIKYRDVNNDGQINELDRVPIGNPDVPEIIYGFGASMNFKSFDFSFFFKELQSPHSLLSRIKLHLLLMKETVLLLRITGQKIILILCFWPRLSTEIIVIIMILHGGQKGDFLRLKNIEFSTRYLKQFFW